MSIAPPSLIAQNVTRIEDLREIWPDFVGNDDNPFVRFDFLHSLEQTGCVHVDTGWQPYHLRLCGQDEKTSALMPLYLKMHSYGEYVFDHAWAHAWQQAGGQYYPKLLASVPFTPVTSSRLLGAAEYKPHLVEALAEICRRHHLSSAHVNFIADADLPHFQQNSDWLIRQDVQFHWMNQDYRDFDDFLLSLKSRKRKNIKKERAAIAAQGVSFRALSGTDITESDWDMFYRFYCDTYDRKWGAPYLTREFFSDIAARMPEAIVLITAFADGAPAAAALNFCDSTALYGRNWGCRPGFRFLHFETCYYQAIDYAIAHGLKRVEAGTQGPHKLDRGYQPVRVFSAHYLPHPEFRQAVARFIKADNAMQEQYFTHAADSSALKT